MINMTENYHEDEQTEFKRYMVSELMVR